MEKFYIYCRYEYISDHGKDFCNWFRVDGSFINQDDAKKKLDEIKVTSSQIDKSTKLKHEYEIRKLDETLIPQIKLKRPKGRPKKITPEELRVFVKALNQKGQLKIDGTMKEYLYNDEDAHKYIQDHLKDKNKWVRYWYDDNEVLYLILKDNTEKIYD